MNSGMIKESMNLCMNLIWKHILMRKKMHYYLANILKLTPYLKKNLLKEKMAKNYQDFLNMVMHSGLDGQELVLSAYSQKQLGIH